MDEVVVVLDADDPGDAARLPDLGGCHIAETELADQPLALELSERGKLLLDRALAWPVNAADAQVDHVKGVNLEVPEVVMDAAREVRRGERRNPRGVGPTHGAELGHDHEIAGVGMKRLPDELVGDVRAIIIAGVDVIDPACHGLAQHDKCGAAILRRPEHAGSGELHGAVAHAVHAAVAQGENASGGNVGHGRPPGRVLHDHYHSYGLLTDSFESKSANVTRKAS